LTKADCCSSFTERGKRLLFVGTSQKIDYAAFPAVLVANHGPFCWGPDAEAAAHNAAVLEAVARMAYFTVRINEQAEPVERSLHDKHYLRKHGSNAHYGQAKESK
jgi:L-ribulose-5-phosphate 4-epimerase